MRVSVHCVASHAAAACALFAVALTSGCAKSNAPQANLAPKDKPREVARPPRQPIDFEDVTKQYGIAFRHVSGNTEDKHFPAANGSGCAIFDYDNDGAQDVYFLTAHELVNDRPGLTNKLFRNALPGAFQDVSALSGLDRTFFCHGVVTADCDNDGFADVLLTTYGGTHLYRNQGDGTFTRVKSIQDDYWGCSAAAADVDNDGDVDFYIARYGYWSIETNEYCGSQERQVRTFCNPKRITPAEHVLYENQGNLAFRNVAKQAGISRDDGRGQGVIAADVDLDGYVDFYVANDICPNFLFINNGRGKFEDLSELSGAAFSREGSPQAGMGVDVADADRDGLPDLFVTNFSREHNAYYTNLGETTFLDKSHYVGLGGDSMNEVGWGTRFVDFDNDGWLDVFVLNGHVDDNVAKLDSHLTYEQPARLWRNTKGKFELVSDEMGGYFADNHVGRGAAFGDLDDDGRIDVAVNHVDRPAAVLRNASLPAEGGGRWLRLSLVGKSSHRDAVGATVLVRDRASGQEIMRQRTSGGSYLSSHDPRVHVGVGDWSEVDVTIRWPSGRQTIIEACPLEANQLVVESLSD